MPFDINIADESAGFTAFSARAQLRLNRKTIEVNAVRATTGRSQAFQVTNVGTSAFTLGTGALAISGPDAAQFSVVGGTLPRRISLNKRAQFFVALTPASNAPTDRVLTAFLDITPDGASSPIARIALRGIATTGEGGLVEPSLARLMELFQYSINVGDTTPNTTLLDLSGSATDELFAPRFQRASEAPVTITPIAQFVTKTATVAGRIGIYTPGVPSSRSQLFELPGADGQSVNPSANGSTTFDPGSSPFSVWAEAPTFIDADGARIVYGEDSLNTWEPNADKRRKVRVYPFVEKGNAVANAYIVTFEEYPPQNDQNDYVFVLRNVTTVKSRPVLGIVSVDGIEDATTLAFNRIQTPNAQIGNAVHDTSKVRIVNTGNKDLLISSFTLGGENPTAFQIVGSPGATTLTRGQTMDVTVKFIATSGDFRTATLDIASNDKAQRVTSVRLNGFWQSDSETNSQGVSQEPSLAEIFKTLGFKTVAVADGENINEHGLSQAVGDEILSAYWNAADAAKPVFIRQVAGFHTQGNTGEIAWYEQGKPFFYPSDPRYPGANANGQQNTLFFTNVNDGQSLFQRKKDSNERAQTSFSTSTNFGFRLDAEYSEDALNNQVQGDLGGHHMRFYPLRNARGDFVPNTYLMTMDYSSINFDYNDNIFLISNMRPADRTGAVEGLTGVAQGGKVTLDWGDVSGAAGYRVLRSDFDGSYHSITSSPLTISTFVDDTATPGRSWYYRVVAVDSQGDLSVPSNERVFLS